MMAKPKPFTPELLEVRLNHAIERLIADKQSLVNAEQGDIRVNEIAQIFKVNVATLRRWCKEHFDKNPIQYLAEYRIARAKKLLRQGKKPSEVSQMLAFAEHKTFSTTFKRYTSNTPANYMKSQFSVVSPAHAKFNK